LPIAATIALEMIGPIPPLAAFVGARQGFDLIRHPCDALIEIFPIIDEARNDPDDTGRQP
jgi:hypothetical protein